ncbi:MAG: TetR/AcrR family transcriptional regulator [Pseudomonadota bacterium]
MALNQTLEKTERQIRLTRDDWIDAALGLLVDRGIDAVQITVLAKHLSVTRGSFYWHFQSHEELLNALVERWSRLNTNVIFEAVKDAQTLDDGILALFSVWTDHTRFDPDLDQAIRDWARHDEALRVKLKIEDQSRVEALAAFFERQGFAPKEAFIRARVLYFTQVTYYALRIADDESLAERLGYLEAYFKSFTGQDIDAGTAEAYRAILLRKEKTS